MSGYDDKTGNDNESRKQILDKKPAMIVSGKQGNSTDTTRRQSFASAAASATKGAASKMADMGRSARGELAKAATRIYVTISEAFTKIYSGAQQSYNKAATKEEKAKIARDTTEQLMKCLKNMEPLQLEDAQDPVMSRHELLLGTVTEAFDKQLSVTELKKLIETTLQLKAPFEMNPPPPLPRPQRTDSWPPAAGFTRGYSSSSDDEFSGMPHPPPPIPTGAATKNPKKL